MDDLLDVDDILDEVEQAEKKAADAAVRTQLNIAIFPLDSGVAHGISSLSVVELARNLSSGGTLGFTRSDSLYAKSCEKGKQMLYRSVALLQQGEEFALKASGYNVGHPPLYLRHYHSKHKETRDDEGSHSALLGEPIDELLRKISDKTEYRDRRTSGKQLRITPKRKRHREQHETNESWLLKYHPRYFSDLLTEESVNIEVFNWLREWKCCKLHGRKPPEQGTRQTPSYDKGNHADGKQDSQDMRRILLLGGPAGVGKSTLVNVLARHCGFDVVEINASEDRSKARLLPIIKGIVMTNAISQGKPHLCLLEEVDGLQAGESQIIGSLKELSQKGHIKRPIVCICNDLYSKNLRELRQIAKVITVETCDTDALKNRLLQIADLEGYHVEEDVIDELMKLHQNDVRSCITALEFIIKNPQLADNLDIFTKDRTQDLLSFLRELFNPKASAISLRNASLSVASVLGTPATSNLVVENVSKVGIKSPFNAIALYDLLAQGDVLQNTTWINVLISFVKMMRLKSAFKFILPPSLCSHNSEIQMSRNRVLIKTLKGNPNVSQSALGNSFCVHVLPALCVIITSVRGGSVTHVNLVRATKEMDILWEAIGPMKGGALHRIVRLAVLLQMHGITVMEDQENFSLDPPILEIYNTRKSPLDGDLCKMLKVINEAKVTIAKDNRPKNLQAYVQELNQLGFVAFMNKYKRETNANEKIETTFLCRKNDISIPPLTFAMMIEQEAQHLAEVLRASDLEINGRTNGVYKFVGEECGAVRYIIHDI